MIAMMAGRQTPGDISNGPDCLQCGEGDGDRLLGAATDHTPTHGVAIYLFYLSIAQCEYLLLSTSSQ